MKLVGNSVMITVQQWDSFVIFTAALPVVFWLM